MSEIICDAVKKVYDPGGEEIIAVDEVSLTIKDGEFLTIVGPSGSGKSTLLRMIAGLESISGGSITIGETVVNNVPPQDRGVAMVFQNYALYPHMTVRKNMSYGLKLTSDLSKKEIRTRVEETAEMMGIGDQLDKKPGNLSGGQQQRVATGRAIVRDPEVFLFDEPLSNLDAKLRMNMRTELQRLQDDLGTTSVYVTHDQTEAMTMSDRIVILNGGEIQQVGTPETVYAEPANRFVADFIGSPSMNFAEVTIRESTIVGEDFEFDISGRIADHVRRTATSEHLTLGIRPEHIELASSQTNSEITATLEVLEHEGSDNYLHMVCGGFELTVRVPGNELYNEGEKLHLHLPEKHLNIFDSDTTENLLISRSNQMGSTIEEESTQTST